jgi:hypothetical protein
MDGCWLKRLETKKSPTYRINYFNLLFPIPTKKRQNNVLLWGLDPTMEVLNVASWIAPIFALDWTSIIYWKFRILYLRSLLLFYYINIAVIAVMFKLQY